MFALLILLFFKPLKVFFLLDLLLPVIVPHGPDSTQYKPQFSGRHTASIRAPAAAERSPPIAGERGAQRNP
jgi:hypothetical protein